MLPHRTLRLLEEVAASRSPAGLNYVGATHPILARHLPLMPAAAAAVALLDHGRQAGNTAADAWMTVRGVEVAASLLKHEAVRADPVAALSQPQLSGEDRTTRVFISSQAWL